MTSPAERLEDAMEERRLELHMNWKDIANAAGLSYEGLRSVRKGVRHPTALTRRQIEDALRWRPGSVDAILNGGEPTPLLTPVRDDRHDETDEPPPYRLRSRVEEYLWRAPDLSPSTRKALIDFLRIYNEAPGRSEERRRA